MLCLDWLGWTRPDKAVTFEIQNTTERSIVINPGAKACCLSAITLPDRVESAEDGSFLRDLQFEHMTVEEQVQANPFAGKVERCFLSWSI